MLRNDYRSRKSGGNDGQLYGPGADDTVCFGSGTCSGKKEKEKLKQRQASSDVESEEEDYGVSFNNLVKQFLGKRGHDADNEAVPENSGAKRFRNEKYEAIRCGTDTEENDEGIYHVHDLKPEELDRMWLAEFRGVAIKRKIIHDVWETPSDGLGERFRRAVIQPLLFVPRRIQEKTGTSGGLRQQLGRQHSAIQGIFIFAEHQKHFHVVHDCAYAGSTCRCTHIQRIKDFVTESDECTEEDERWKNTQQSTVPEGEIPLSQAELRNASGRRGRGRSPGSPVRSVPQTQTTNSRGGEFRGRNAYAEKTSKERRGLGSVSRRYIQLYGRISCQSALFSVGHWKNLSIYFDKGGRRLHEFHVGGRAWLTFGQARTLPLQRVRKSTEEPILERADFLKPGDMFVRGFACIQDSDEASLPDNETSSQSRQSGGNKENTNRLEKFLKSFVISPTKNIMNSGHWTKGPFKYMPRNKAILQTCFHNINLEIADMSYREIFLSSRVISMNKLIYVAPWNNVGGYYYNIKDSMAVLEELLKFQMDNDKTAV